MSDVQANKLIPKTKKKLRKKRKKRNIKKHFDIDVDLIKEYVNSKSLTQEEIEIYIKRVIELYEKEKENRNFFQLERDKFKTLKEIDEKKLEELKAELILARDEISNLELRHNDDIMHLKQKVRYLISEHQMKLNNLKLEFEEQNKENININLKEKEESMNYIKQLLSIIYDKETQLENVITNLTSECEKKISQMAQDYAEKHRLVRSTLENRFNDERSKFSLITKNAVHEITELKNAQIQQLIQQHSKAYDDLRNYFKDLINNTMITISNLKEKNANVNSLHGNIAKLKSIEVDLKEKIEENKKLKNEFVTFKQRIQSSDTEKKLCKNYEIKYNSLQNKFSKLEIKHEALKIEYEKLVKELEYKTKSYHESNFIYQEKCNNHLFLCNQKVEILQNELKKYQNIIKSFKLQNQNMDESNAHILAENNCNFNEIMRNFTIKDKIIANLNHKLFFITEKYNELLKYIKIKGNFTSIALDMVGFKPIKLTELYHNEQSELCKKTK